MIWLAYIFEDKQIGVFLVEAIYPVFPAGDAITSLIFWIMI